MTAADKQGKKSAIEQADAELLASLGYKQEFQRAFTGLEVGFVFLIARVLLCGVCDGNAGRSLTVCACSRRLVLRSVSLDSSLRSRELLMP